MTMKEYDEHVPTGKTRKIGIVLMRLQQINPDYDYQKIYKTVEVEIPDDGYAWSVVGEAQLKE